MNAREQEESIVALWRQVRGERERLYWRHNHLSDWGANDIAMIKFGTARTYFSSYTALRDYLSERLTEKGRTHDV